MAIPRLALIGKGRWGSVIRKTLLAMPTCELAYEVTHDWETLLEKNDIDGVIVATPPTTHAAIALPFIERSIPVFIEKPLTASLTEAKKIEAATQKNGTVVMVGHIYLYNPAFLAVKKLTQTSGPVRMLISEGANNGPFRNEYSALWDWAPHDLSMMLDLLGEEPISVAAWAVASTRPNTALWDRAQMKLAFPGGAIGFISSTWLFPEKHKRLTVVAEKNSIVFEDTLPEHKIAFYSNMGPRIEDGTLVRQEPTISYPSFDTTPPLTLELQTFLHAIATGEKPVSDVRVGVHIVEILDAAERSIASGGTPVKIPPRFV